MKNKIKVIILTISLSVIFSLLVYQFIINPKVKPYKSQQVFANEEIIRSTAGTVIGRENAKLTIIEFSDYGCAACKMLYKNFKEINFYSKYIKTGLVRYVFKDVPANSHPNSREASMVTLAAKRQGKYWEMHSILFEKSHEWSNAKTGFECFEKYAKELNLNLEQFKKDLSKLQKANSIDQTREEFQKLGFPGTPILIIGDTQVNGTPSPEELKKLIEKELNQ
ncbi:hypothetical protein PTHTG4_31600 [Parageobacillus thermoglucosidasius]|uniref:DsbA family protein n=1 Tax=Parageobacillus thermoglucosidasius TaxID=1426 RepID=UPI000FF9C76E|nr:thioredoxin domain-containing protein [Parageobacillus thermoglucosidasius]GCD84095.1 hypothetical protein PTHTG4_31600 [Parageobacillus thermoglucosidasius]